MEHPRFHKRNFEYHREAFETSCDKFAAFEQNLKNWLKGPSFTAAPFLSFLVLVSSTAGLSRPPRQDFTSAPAGESDPSAVHVGAGDCGGHSPAIVRANSQAGGNDERV